MSETSTPEERTEMPTERRMQQLRQKGQLFHSNDVSLVVSLFSGFMVLSMTWQFLLSDMKLTLVKSFQLISHGEILSTKELHAGFVGLIMLLGPDLLIIVTVIAAIAILTVMLQTDWNVREKKIEFRWAFLNPITGLMRIVSIHGIVNTLKALLKLVLILPIGFFALKAFAPDMVQLIHLTIPQIMSFTGSAINTLFWRILYILIAFAIFDYFWGKFQWLKANKMTKAEVKDERKAVEGDEETKRRIQLKGLQRVLQRIMSSVPEADVVVTNPTHYSVALKYVRGKDSAPKVVAKGQGFLALRIREIAKEHGVPVLERKPLARALYASTEVGSEIPYELFKAVAEVLAYVYKLKNPHGQTAQAR